MAFVKLYLVFPELKSPDIRNCQMCRCYASAKLRERLKFVMVEP